MCYCFIKTVERSLQRTRALVFHRIVEETYINPLSLKTCLARCDRQWKKGIQQTWVYNECWLWWNDRDADRYLIVNVGNLSWSRKSRMKVQLNALYSNSFSTRNINKLPWELKYHCSCTSFSFWILTLVYVAFPREKIVQNPILSI